MNTLLTPYNAYADELVVQNSIIFKGKCVMMPQSTAVKTCKRRYIYIYMELTLELMIA